MREHGTAVAAMPVKDTIKMVSEEGIVTATPDRSKLWQIQTPQIFRFADIKAAYDRMMLSEGRETVTDDAMVMEQYGKCNIRVFEGSYDNIKVTTPEDLQFIKNILKFQ